MQIDVFNGDADGICALLQLRLAEPMESTLITGVKRQIDLLNTVEAKAGDTVTVLDISMDKNQQALERLLQQQVRVFYVDHHQATHIPIHSNLKTRIDTSVSTCTSLLINDYLQNRYLLWAIVAAFGDNLLDVATHLAQSLGLLDQQIDQLKELGICINYNGYGDSLADLHFAPADLYAEMRGYQSPFDFMTSNLGTYHKLVSAYQTDIALAKQVNPLQHTARVAVYQLPNQAWSRRVSGVFGNELANEHPDRAHAIVSETRQGDYQISVRAPLNNKMGADELCAKFPTGGGRKAAAGINHLAIDQLSAFIDAFIKHYH